MCLKREDLVADWRTRGDPRAGREEGKKGRSVRREGKAQRVGDRKLSE